MSSNLFFNEPNIDIKNLNKLISEDMQKIGETDLNSGLLSSQDLKSQFKKNNEVINKSPNKILKMENNKSKMSKNIYINNKNNN